jgi:hypothetical protein
MKRWAFVGTAFADTVILPLHAAGPGPQWNTGRRRPEEPR